MKLRHDFRVTIRWLILVVTAAGVGGLLGCVATRLELAQAQSKQAGAEEIAAWNSPAFAPLRAKTTLWDDAILPSMTRNPDAPTSDERKAALAWADRLDVFNKKMIQWSLLQVPPHLATFYQPILERYTKADVNAVLLLAEGRLSWGQFNTVRVENLAQV